MSFCRMGPESDLYIFNHSGFDDVVCFACLLLDQSPDVQDVYNFHTRSLQGMLNHVQEHRDAGDAVPDDLEAKLKERWPYEK